MSDDIATGARRRTRALVSTVVAVVLGLTVISVGLLVAVRHRGDPVSGPAAMATVPIAGPVDGTAASDAAGSAVPDDVRWSTVAGAQVPASATAGPHDTAAGRARGFAHTELGAVLAAANISVRLSPQVGPAVFEPTVHEQVVGDDTDTLSQHLDDDYQAARAQLGLPYGAPAGRLYSTTAGYRAQMQGTDAATVRLLIEGPGQSGGSVFVALVTRVQWTGTDWVLQAPTHGNWNADATVVTDASGYTSFPNRPKDGS